VVAYRAPRITYAADSAPRDRLFALLGEMRVEPDEVVAAEPEAGWTPRLQAYRRARDQFLEAGRFVQASGDARHMLSQVREPLLASLRTSADFRPAYDPLLRLAAALARTDPAAARALLTELTQLHPSRPEAAQLLARLGTAWR
jgi:spermidine synthase